jgi:prolyl oligopeptidase
MRRDLWLILACLTPFVVALAAVAPPEAEGPPPAPRRPVTDRYVDIEVADDYRWLENCDDPAVRTWSEAQNTFARSRLDALPAMPAIRERVKTIAEFPSPQYSRLTERRGLLFALKSQPPKQQPFLVTLASAEEPASERVIVDPNVLDAKGGVAIDWFVPSWDGRLVAVSLSQGGSESGTLRVYETLTGRMLPDSIPRVQSGTAGGDAAWTGDASGFFYTRYPRAGEKPAEDLEFYQQVFFHALGTPIDRDVYSLGKDFPRIAETRLDSSPDGRFVLATVKNGDGGEASLFLRKPDGTWTRVAADADRVVLGRFASDGSLYLLSYGAAPRGRILRIPPGGTSLADAAVILPEGEPAIDAFALTETRIYVAFIEGGPSRMSVYDRTGKAVAAVAIAPLTSVTDLTAVAGDAVLFESQSWLEPPAWYRAGPDGQLTKTPLARTSPVDFAGIEVVRDWAVSKDGTRVPIDILRRKGTKLDGKNPTLLYGYGGYGISQRPKFDAMRRVWLEQGGVYAVALLRGGGEFGDAWHLAGNLTRKQNVFDDFAACAKRLVAAGYTTPARLAIEGGSNGGLLMGAAFTQNPDLFGAVVAHVGIYDMLRVELSPNGQYNVTEFGTVKKPAELRALYAYSPYHHVVDKVVYPPILFMTGANDPRVDPMQSRKMTARMQAAGGPAGSVLLRTSASSGHGIGSSLDEKTAQAADVYAFLFDRLGVPYAPAPPAPSPTRGKEGRKPAGTPKPG